MNGKQLKNSILQWAIQGKLVPQDPNDEPASVLLERIRAEKARLIKEGKIKRDKNETIIFRGDDNSHYEKLPNGEVRCIDSEIPFEIPSSWVWCRIGDIAIIKGGKRLPVGETFSDTPTTHIYIRVTEMKNNTLVSKSLKYISERLFQQLKNYTISSTDLYLTIAGTIGDAGIVPQEFDGMNLTENAVKLTEIKLNKKYLLYCILSDCVQSQFVGKTNKVGQPKLAIERIKTTYIPIAPLCEQQRIVDRIEKLLPIVTKYDDTQRQLDILNTSIKGLLKKSILQEAIQGRLVAQDNTEEPASELLKRIKEEKQKLVKEGKLKAKDITDSIIYKGDDNKYYEQIGGTAIEIDSDFDFPNTWKVVRLADICRLIDGERKQGKYICLDAKYLRGKSSGDILNEGKFVVKDDNIILVDGENSGEVFTVPHEGYMGSTFKQLWVSSEMYLSYVLYFIQFYKDRLRNSKKGAAIPHLNKEIFYNLLIGIPPKDEQIRISAKVADLYNNL